MPAYTSSYNGGEFEFLGAAWIHIARKEKHTGNMCGRFIRQDQCDDCAITPTDQRCLLKVQCIHHRQNIGCHQFIRKRSLITRTTTMTAAVYHYGLIATTYQRGNLIAPVATMAKAAVQQDHGRAGPVGCIPYPDTVVFHIALITCDWQRRGPIRFKPG